MKSEVKRLNKAQAVAMLERNTKNRTFRAQVVGRYKREMNEGRWRSNGATIVVGSDGVVLDGQHRLAAFIASSLNYIDILLVTDVDPLSFSTIDQGTPRTGADPLSISGYRDTKNLAAASKFVILYKSGTFIRQEGISHSTLLEFVENHPQIITSVGFACKLAGQGILSQSIAAGMHFLASELDPKQADEFINDIHSGANLRENDPVMTLRRALIRNAASISKLSRVDISSMVIEAWNARRTRRVPRSLASPKGSPFPKLI